MTDQARIYAALPYAVEVVPQVTTDGEMVYLARHPELAGCMAHGDTPEDAALALNDARALYVESMLEDGLTPPFPTSAALGVPAFSAVWTSRVLQPAQGSVVAVRRVVEQVGGPRMEMEQLAIA